MSFTDKFLTPVGRLVQGSLYNPNTTDAENKPLTYKTGPEIGKSRIEFFFAVAIPKGAESHWSQTEWGAKIWAVGHQGFPNGQASSPTFAWKLTDGDSAIPNKAGTKPCECEGFPGNWILKFKNGYAITICNADGSALMQDVDAVKLGDYVQVAVSVLDNGSSQQPGVFLNPTAVAFAGYGKRIVTGFDTKSLGFGGVPLPAGASLTPIAQGFVPPVSTPVSVPAPVQTPTYPAPVNPQITAAAPPPPHVAILNVPAAPQVAPARVMLPAANGITYDQYRANGWSDVQLIQMGMMQA